MTHDIQAFRITSAGSWLMSRSFLASETSLSCKQKVRGQGGHIYLWSVPLTPSQRGCLLRQAQHKHINNTVTIACPVSQGLDITSIGSTEDILQSAQGSDIILMWMSSTACPRHDISILLVGTLSTICTTMHGVIFCASTC